MRITCGPAGQQAVITGAPTPGAAAKGAATWCGWRLADTAVGHLRTRSWPPRSVSPVKRLISVTGTHHQDQLDEISYRIKALDPDVMFDERFDKQVRRLRAERDRLKALPAEPDRWDEQPTGDLYVGIYQALPASERGA
jgi:hypothetical protein